MPTTSNLSKFLNRTGSRILLLSRIQLRFLSAASVLLPSHSQIADIILEQKSANEALQTFEWASRIPNFTHTSSTYRALIHKLCTFRQFRIVQQLLEEMSKTISSPPDDDIFITVVRGYGRAKMTREVVRVLDLVPKLGNGGNPSLKLMNTILDILVKEDIDIAREFYRKKMMGSGMKGDDYTYGILMKGFCRTNRIGDGFKLLQIMKNHNVNVNVVVYNTLIYALCKNGKVGRARSLMNKMEEFSDVTFNILISAYCDDSNLVQALVMMEKCFIHGFVPDVVTLTKVLEILCSAGRLNQAVEVLDRVEVKGGTLDVVAYNTLLKGFVKAGKVKAARGFLKQMEIKGCLPTIETYNIMIAGYCEVGMLDSAHNMFHEMKRVGVQWNCITFETLIRGLCSSGRTKDGFMVFELMVEDEGSCNATIHPFNSILYGLYRENSFNRAYEFLNYMRYFFPRAVEQTSKILQLCEKESVEEAKQVLDEMKERGGFPSAIVYVNLILGMCRKGCTKEAVEVMSEMIGLGYFPIASTFNGVVDRLCREGKVGSAVKLLEDLKARDCLLDCESYTVVMDALLCSRGELGQVLTLLMEMTERGIVPDCRTWNTVVLDTLKGKKLLGGCELLQWLAET